MLLAPGTFNFCCNYVVDINLRCECYCNVELSGCGNIISNHDLLVDMLYILVVWLDDTGDERWWGSLLHMLLYFLILCIH